MVWALKSKLGFVPDVDNIKDIDRRKAKMLIDGLLEEVEKLQSDEN
jgi:tRNA A37 N6-isopentenylltransferase MiaA